MNQVFLILVHKNPEQLLMLLKQLESNESHFFIHVDLKGRIEDFKEATKLIKNVRFIKKQYDHHWGSYILVKAIMALINELQSETQLDYSHAHLISGEDILTKPIVKLVQFFSTNSKTNYMNFSAFPVNGWWNGGLYRITHYHFGKFKRAKSFLGKCFLRAYNYLYILFPFLKKKLIKDLEFYGGSAWWSISKESINFIHNYVEQNPKFSDFFKYSILSDEIFFQTILMNSKLKDSVDNNYKRYIKWVGPDFSSPVYLTLADYYTIKASDSFFARKIDFGKSSELYNMF